MTDKKQTIALCMIVKNESEVITRAFDSVRNFVDYYCICDTGSTDGTQEIIKDYFKKHNLKGKVHDRPWVNFGHNRTECFELAQGKADYLMTLDADEIMAPYSNGNAVLDKKIKSIPKLVADHVMVTTHYGNSRYLRTCFVKNNMGFRWEQPVHEYCHSPEEKTKGYIEDICNYVTTEGARSKDPKKFFRDALVFETHLLDNPEDGRAWFYLAQSYMDAMQPNKALEAIDSALKYVTWDQEKYILYLRKGRLLKSLKNPCPEFLDCMFSAYNVCPERAEAVGEILKHFYQTSNWNSIIAFGGQFQLKDPRPDFLFVEKVAYEWIIPDLLGLGYYYTGNKKLAKKHFMKALSFDVDETTKERLKKNIDFCIE